MISIIIPLYNKEKSISSTIESVLNQNFKDFELVIVNDGSTDTSLTEVQKFEDFRINLFSIENSGVSAARNFGANVAKFDWLFFLDADDQIVENCLDIYLAMVHDFPDIKFFTTNFIAKNNIGEETICCYGSKRGEVKYPFKAMWQRKIFPRTGAMLIHKPAYESVNGFRSDCSLWEDLEVVLKLLEKYDIVYDPKPVFIHFLEHNILSQKRHPLKKEYAFYIELSENKVNFYHKLLLLELLERTKKKRIGLNDQNAVKLLNQKIGFNGWLLFSGRIERYILKTLRAII